MVKEIKDIVPKNGLLGTVKDVSMLSFLIIILLLYSLGFLKPAKGNGKDMDYEFRNTVISSLKTVQDSIYSMNKRLVLLEYKIDNRK